MNDENRPGEDAGISTRTVEIAVALLLFAFGATVVVDSYRLGSTWGSDGPQSGYFPFYIGLLICISSLATLGQVLFAEWRAREDAFSGAVARRRLQFVGWGPFKQVLSVLLPAVVYVLFVQLIGIYVASAVYIAVFMVWLGKYSWLKSAAVGLLVNIGIFAMFEIWFKVPLYKGIHDPLAWLGF
jgi:hypothetical protein